MNCPNCQAPLAKDWKVCGVCKCRRFPKQDPDFLWKMVNGLVKGMLISDPRWKTAAKWLHENHPLK